MIVIATIDVEDTTTAVGTDATDEMIFTMGTRGGDTINTMIRRGEETIMIDATLLKMIGHRTLDGTISIPALLVPSQG